jgi:hypothetical protein
MGVQPESWGEAGLTGALKLVRGGGRNRVAWLRLGETAGVSSCGLVGARLEFSLKDSLMARSADRTTDSQSRTSIAEAGAASEKKSRLPRRESRGDKPRGLERTALGLEALFRTLLRRSAAAGSVEVLLL